MDEQKRTPLEILYSISRELATSLDLHQVLARILILSTEYIGAERASLVVLDKDGKPVDAAMIYDGVLMPHTIEQMQDVVTSGLAGWVLQNKKPALIPNTQLDQRWLTRPEDAGEKDAARSALAVPLMVHESVVGVLTIVHAQINFFSQEQFSLQQAIADLAGIAIRNAQLYEEVQTAHLRYRDLFEESIDPIFITTMNGLIIECNNRAEIATGLKQVDLQNKRISELQEIPAEIINKNKSSSESNESLTYESMLKYNQGDNKPVEVHVSTIHIQGNKYLQWIFRDISERKNLDTLREDLSAMIYHDLRSPLANIISSMDLMRTMVPMEEGSPTQQLFEISTRSTERMQRLISSLLDINRLESGQTITDKQYVDCNKLINDSVEAMQPNAANKNLSIEKMIVGKLPTIFADQDMMRRVLINLLENAIKFSPQADKVTIGAKPSGNQVVFWVEDHGPGIPNEAKERIFNKFVRIRAEGVAKGLGLGLAFCRIAVQSHGGKIWVENIPEGGSRFIVSVPAVNK